MQITMQHVQACLRNPATLLHHLTLLERSARLARECACLAIEESAAAQRPRLVTANAPGPDPQDAAAMRVHQVVEQLVISICQLTPRADLCARELLGAPAAKPAKEGESEADEAPTLVLSGG